MQRPGKGVEEADEGGFADATFEERVRGEGAEGVVADFGVGGGGAAVDEGEIGVCGERRAVEQDEPDVNAELGLCGEGLG